MQTNSLICVTAAQRHSAFELHVIGHLGRAGWLLVLGRLARLLRFIVGLARSFVRFAFVALAR